MPIIVVHRIYRVERGNRRSTSCMKYSLFLYVELNILNVLMMRLDEANID